MMNINLQYANEIKGNLNVNLYVIYVNVYI